MQLTLTALLPLLASIADARHLPLRRHRQDQQQLHFQHARDMNVALDERGLPITATTVVVVEMTSTQTVWVPPTPTGQVPFEPTQSASASESGNVTSVWESGSASASESASVSDWEASSAVPTESLSYSSETPEMSASASNSDWASSIASSTSAWVSESYSSGSASATASPSSTDSASSSGSSSTESASITDSGYSSASASAPASGSASDAASSSSYSDSLTEASAPPSSIPSASASASASASEETSVRWTRTSASGASQPTEDAASSAWSSGDTSIRWSRTSASRAPQTTANASANATSSESASESTSMRWTRTSASEAPQSTSVDATSSASPSASSSSMWNETSVSASSSAASSSSNLPSSTSASFSAAPASTRLPNVPRTIMAGYYPDWSAWTLPPESVDWSKFDVVDFAFALPTADGRLEFTQDDSSDLLQRLVKGAHKNGKRVKLSIGGWTGSKYFSTLVADPAKRTNFINNCVQAYWAYGLDGIDIDWEYPNAQGAGGNAISSADSANFLLYLQELRTALPSEALITLATQVWPFAGANGRPLGDVSGFAAVIDWILIMNYDIWGSSDNPGPNAPLSDECKNSTQPLANAFASVNSWMAAGMPASQITLGVPAYGYLQKSWASQLRQRDYIPPSADEVANMTSTLDKRQSGLVTVRNGGGGDNNGQIGFADLVKQGALAKDSSGAFIGAGGFYREWDACSSTPWIRSSYTGQVVTYDDPYSLSLKAQFARQSGLRGCNMFSMDGDWTGSNWPLVDALRSGMGI